MPSGQGLRLEAAWRSAITTTIDRWRSSRAGARRSGLAIRRSTRRGSTSGTTQAARSRSWRSPTRTTCAGSDDTPLGRATAPRSSASSAASGPRPTGSAERAQTPTGPPLPCRVILVGMMGSGKSTIGRLLADGTGWPYVDNDELVARLHGATSRQLLATVGEERMRLAELD